MKGEGLWILGIGTVGSLVIVGALGAVYLVRRYLRSELRGLTHARRMRRTALVEAREGVRAKIVGKLRSAAEPLVAPISGLPCVYYRVVLKQGTDDDWRVVFKEERVQDTWLEDADGTRAIVRTAGVHVHVFEQRNFTTAANPKAPLETFLQVHSDATRALVGRGCFASEEVLQAGELVAVIGAVRRTLGGGAYRDATIAIESPRSAVFLVTNDPQTVQ